MKYLVAFRGWDDDWDTDNGYTGKVQFFVSLRDPASADQSQSNGFESDNDSDGDALTPITSPLFVNGSVFGPLATSSTSISTLYRHSMQLRRGTRTSIYNTVFAGWPYGLYIDGQKGDSPAQATSNVLQIENCVMSGMTANYVTTYMANTEEWYLDQTRHNEIIATNDLLLLNDPFNLTVSQLSSSYRITTAIRCPLYKLKANRCIFYACNLQRRIRHCKLDFRLV